MNKVLSEGPQVRKVHAYCLGTGRSGTRSIAGIFSSYYRSAHEPQSKKFLLLIMALRKGLINKQEFTKHVVHLDNKLGLELNSSFLNNWLLDVFLVEFPEAKFILTIRDCYSWLDSFINGEILKENEEFLDIVFGKGVYQYPKEEQVLYEKGKYTLDGLLSYWANINNEILTTVPKSRLLVVKTHEISAQKGDIAEFLGVSPKTLDFTKAHMSKSVKHPNILSKIDKDYLSSRINFHCQALMDKFFPGVVHTFE